MAVGPNIPSMEKTYNALINTNVGLLIAAGIVGIFIAIVALQMARTGGILIRAKDAENNAKLATLTTQTEQARAKQYEIEQQNVILRTNLANAQQDLLNLKNRIKWRQISEEQRTQLVTTLKSVSKVTVRISFAGPENGEPYLFAKRIREVLREALWDVDRLNFGPGTSPESPSPFCIVVRDDNRITEEEKALRNAFINAVLPVDVRGDKHAPADGIWMFVGDRLQP